MSKVAELSYEIESLYIEGFSPKTIALMLECPIELVYAWIEEQGVGTDEDEEIYSPYYGA
jgi:hypothetical protein